MPVVLLMVSTVFEWIDPDEWRTPELLSSSLPVPRTRPAMARGREGGREGGRMRRRTVWSHLRPFEAPARPNPPLAALPEHGRHSAGTRQAGRIYFCLEVQIEFSTATVLCTLSV